VKEVRNVTSIAADDPYVTTLFKNISDHRHVMSVGRDETIFSQGDRADSVYFIQSGSVKISVVSYAGKEGVLAIMGPHGFFGEESLAEQSLRTNTATAMEPSTVLQIEKRAMVRALHAQSDLAEVFLAFLLKRSINLEEDLADQLFNHSEKRLARVLLKLAELGEHGAVPDTTIPKLSHETLAEMVGTTRSRITHFMNKFRKMHLIEYNGHARDRGFGLIVRTGRLTEVVLQD
jgi:CRP/FNR family cyclic AMP-dependent transcriptional regulator